MQSIEKLNESINTQLDALLRQNEAYKPHAEKIRKSIAYIQNEKDKKILDPIVTDFRKWLNEQISDVAKKPVSAATQSGFAVLSASIYSLFSFSARPNVQTDLLVPETAFQDVVYDALIIVAMIKPVNNEDPCTQSSLDDISWDEVIFLADGYFFEIKSLAEWIKTKGIMENYATHTKLHDKDQLAIIAAAKKINIDLENLNPSAYKVEEHPAILAGAIVIAQNQDNDDSDEEKSSFGNFSELSSFILDMSANTGISPQELVSFQSEHPYQFASLSVGSPYVHLRLISVDEAKSMPPEQRDVLEQLTLLNGAVAENIKLIGPVTASNCRRNNRAR